MAISLANEDPASVQQIIQTYGLGLVLEDTVGDVFSDYTAVGSVPHIAIINGAVGTNYDQWEVLYTDVGYASGRYATFRQIIDSVEAVPQLQAGDANQDLEFNQLDLLQVLRARKYATGQAATWGEGDWNGAPGGTVGAPPPGDGLFNQLDAIAALAAGYWLTGPYAAQGTPPRFASAGARDRLNPLAGVEMAAAPVPEPTSLLLLGLGLVVVLLVLCGSAAGHTGSHRTDHSS
jgi:hypothetical protein